AGVGVFDGAEVVPNQPADVVACARDAAGDISVADGSVPLFSDQPADVGTARDADAHQPDMANPGGVGLAKQPHIVLTTTVDGQIAEGMTQAVEFSGEYPDIVVFIPT